MNAALVCTLVGLTLVLFPSYLSVVSGQSMI